MYSVENINCPFPRRLFGRRMSEAVLRQILCIDILKGRVKYVGLPCSWLNKNAITVCFKRFGVKSVGERSERVAGPLHASRGPT